MRKFRIALLLYAAFDLFILGNTAGFIPLTPLVAAQNVPNSPPIRPMPDCILTPNAAFTAVGTSAVYDNRGMGCTTWHLVYSNTGFSALNIALQSADDNGGTPSAFANWGTSGGTLASGTTLPLTATTSGQATGYKYRPFIQVNASSLTGSGRVWWIAYGYRPGLTDSTSSGTSFVQGVDAAGATSTSNSVPIGCQYASGGATVTTGQTTPLRCSTQGELSTAHFFTPSDAMVNSSGATAPVTANGNSAPLMVFTGQFDGTTWERTTYCPNTGKVNALGAATVALVAPVAGKKVRICSFQVSNNNATATTLKVVEGTGATCATVQTDLTSLMNIGATTTTPFAANISSNSPWITNVVADGACVTSSAASSLEITYTWEQH